MLRLAVKIMVWIAVLGFVWALFGSLPDRRGDTTEVVRFDVSDMLPGDYRLVEWQKKPLFIVYRKAKWEEQLQQVNAEEYRDAQSAQSSQPDNATNALRSPERHWFVTLGLGTGMGCTLVFSEPDERRVGIAGRGGFVDGCDQSRFDLAGRVYTEQQARRNTVIPNWSLVNGEILVGGE